MARRRSPAPKKGKPKPKKSYALISGDTEEGASALKLLARAIEKFRPELEGARIGVAWNIGKKPDKDGFLQLGRMKRLAELDREMLHLDAIVILNQEQWRVMNPDQQLALMHHELCHLEPARDNEGEQAIDGHGNLRWRGRRHDIEEFRAVIAEHGYYKNDLAEFVSAALKRDRNPTPQLPFEDGLAAQKTAAESQPGGSQATASEPGNQGEPDKATGPAWKPGDSMKKLRTLAEDTAQSPVPHPLSRIRFTETELNAVNDCATALPHGEGTVPFLASRDGLVLYNGTLVTDVVKALDDHRAHKRPTEQQTYVRAIRKIKTAMEASA